MKRHKIEFVKAPIGRPDWCVCTELKSDGSMSPISGDLVNLKEIDFISDDLRNGDLSSKKFEVIVTGFQFEILYSWKDYRDVWHKCDVGKYRWCQGQNKTVKIEFRYIGS